MSEEVSKPAEEEDKSIKKANSWLGVFKSWIGLISATAVALGGGVSATVSWAKAQGLWGGRIETANQILADQHIGEAPKTEKIILDTPEDFHVVKIFDNGDSVYHRRYVDAEGNMQRVNRWTSKKPLEALLKTTNIDFSFIQTAHAGHQGRSARDIISEKFVGKNSDGYSVYETKWKGLLPLIPPYITCVIINEGTGEVVEELAPPCEALVVPKETE